MYRIVYKRVLKDYLKRHLNTKVDSTVRRGQTLLVSKIAMILEILNDGKWHEMEELQQRMELDGCKVQEIAWFLNEYDFATVDDANRKVRINRDFHGFLART
jgi:hypothetical protein